MLEGYRTYICAALAAIVSILFFLKMIDKTTFDTLMGILLAAGAASLRSGQASEAEKAVNRMRVVDQKLNKLQESEDKECDEGK